MYNNILVALTLPHAVAIWLCLTLHGVIHWFKCTCTMDYNPITNHVEKLLR